MNIALVQMPSSSDVSQNLSAMVRFAHQAKQSGCAAVCFPEASLTGYAPEDAPLLALNAQSPPLLALCREAQALQIDLLVGYMERCGDACFLTHSLLGADGTRHDYRKTHLGEKEARYFSAGSCLDVFTLSCGVRAGFQLCVETHFPQITQTLSLKGAQLVFAPHAVPGTSEKRRSLWQTYIPARAYDNRVYVACCNQWDGQRFCGGCYAANPRGEVIAEHFAQMPELTVFSIDPSLADSYRRPGGGITSRYYPERRKPHLYL